MSKFDDLFPYDPEDEKRRDTEIVADLFNAINNGQVELLDQEIGGFEGFKFPHEIKDKPPLNVSSSRSDVRFLGAVCRDQDGNLEDLPIPVFVKKLPIKQLEKELKGSQLVESIGIRTFPIVAAIRHEEIGYLITRKQDITPLQGISFPDFDSFKNLAERVCIQAQKMHDAGLMHYDFKPKNIGIDAEENIYIYDFQDSLFSDTPLTYRQREKDLGEYFLSYLETELKVRKQFHQKDNKKVAWYEGREQEVSQLMEELKVKYTVPSGS